MRIADQEDEEITNSIRLHSNTASRRKRPSERHNDGRPHFFVGERYENCNSFSLTHPQDRYIAANICPIEKISLKGNVSSHNRPTAGATS